MARHRRFRLPPALYWTALGGLAGFLLFDLLVMPMFVRRGAETEVPDLRGQPATQAERLLAASELRVGDLVRSHDEEVEAGGVLRQSPPAGMRVKRGRAIDLMVSLGPESRSVPALEGESMSHARFLLQREQLAVGRVRAVQSPEVARDCVVASSPPAETRLGGRSVVDLLVSSGPPPPRYCMPDLTGAEADAAEAQLTRAGFKVELSRPGRGAGPAGTVQGQSPAAGRPITPGDEIELAVAR
jgi:serine/threonine-protein kinase